MLLNRKKIHFGHHIQYLTTIFVIIYRIVIVFVLFNTAFYTFYVHNNSVLIFNYALFVLFGQTGFFFMTGQTTIA